MAPDSLSRGLIVTADDFGLDLRINEAVEQAHLHGVLTAASLMVGAKQAGDAIARAQRLPYLRVGLHLVLIDGVSVLPYESINRIVNHDGQFRNAMVRDSFRMLASRTRAQVADEIRAQFDAFARTGLALDHVNTHKHFHLHPVVMDLIIKIGRDYGLRAMRLPRDIAIPLWLLPWIGLAERKLDRARITYNDYMIGLRQTGKMNETAWLDALQRLPTGIGELYCHPAIASTSEAVISSSMQDYRHADEFDALTSPRVADALRNAAVSTGGFSDLLPTRDHV